MKVLGFSAVLVLALASMVNGHTVYSQNCTTCPDCITEASPDGTFNYAIPSDKCSYCHCVNGVPHINRCENDGEYDPELDECVSSDCCHSCCDDCCLNDCPICYHGIDYPIKNPDKCSYCLCSKDGGIYVEKCPWGYRFNPETHACDIKDPDCCDGREDCCGIECPADDQEHRYPNDQDPSDCTFCCCLPYNNSGPVVRMCPFGEKYIDGDCVKTSEPCHHSKLLPGEERLSDSCGHVQCPSDFKKARLFPCPSDTGSYCKCQSTGIAVKTPCKYGKMFSDKKQTCL